MSRDSRAARAMEEVAAILAGPPLYYEPTQIAQVIVAMAEASKRARDRRRRDAS